MSVTLLFVLVFAILVYWLYTQILPERRKSSMLRAGLGDGLLNHVNELRRARGLPLLELDEELCIVAENKSVHQIMTGRSEDGWAYPADYAAMFGQSLLMEALFMGPVDSMVERIGQQKDVFDGEWVRCGIGVAGGHIGQVAVALILCREPWEPAPEVANHRALAERA